MVLFQALGKVYLLAEITNYDYFKYLHLHSRLKYYLLWTIYKLDFLNHFFSAKALK